MWAQWGAMKRPGSQAFGGDVELAALVGVGVVAQVGDQFPVAVEEGHSALEVRDGGEVAGELERAGLRTRRR